MLGLAAVAIVAGAAGWFSLDKETRGVLATLPHNRDLLFWNQAQRDAAFRALDRLPILAKSRGWARLKRWTGWRSAGPALASVWTGSRQFL